MALNIWKCPFCEITMIPTAERKCPSCQASLKGIEPEFVAEVVEVKVPVRAIDPPRLLNHPRQEDYEPGEDLAYGGAFLFGGICFAWYFFAQYENLREYSRGSQIQFYFNCFVFSVMAAIYGGVRFIRGLIGNWRAL